ncbi:hypothetical protein CFOL_v3_19766 [Cephalotus follicularis]|uniref:Uncharacterized protein n=1 Tax=Cephalotus follicularis TaxID=3775 RepID=A0A1Q3C876_CEPFO|nr:hypothetical protein CFOL_v3_19766 [Cephalotus follicularis]
MSNARNSEGVQGFLFQEFLQSINQPLLESEVQQSICSAPVTFDQDKFSGLIAGLGGREKAAPSSAHVQKVASVRNEPLRIRSLNEGDQESTSFPVCHKQKGKCQNLLTSDTSSSGVQDGEQDALEMFKSALAMCSPPPFELDTYREFDGPIYDIPFYTRVTESSSSLSSFNCSGKLSLAYNTEDTEHRIGQRREIKALTIPSLKDANQVIGQSKQNKLFDERGEKLNWTPGITGYDQVPKWLQATNAQVNALAAHISYKGFHNTTPLGKNMLGSMETAPDASLRAGRISAPSERNEYFNSIPAAPSRNENWLEGGGSFFNRDNGDHLSLKRARNYIDSQYSGCSEPLLATQRLVRMAPPTIPSQKFGSPPTVHDWSNSALEGRADKFVQGDIAVSGADPLFLVSPNPGSSNSMLADAKNISLGAAESYRNIISQYARRPTTSETKMSAIIQRKVHF